MPARRQYECARMRSALVATLLAAACTSTGASASKTHLGLGAGAVRVDFSRVDNADVPKTTTEFDDDFGTALMLEAGSESDAFVTLARLQYGVSDHSVPDFGSSARVQQCRLIAMAGPAPIGGEVCSLQPLLGVGFGVVRIDYDANPFLSDLERGMVDVDLGLELLWFRRFTIGAMGSIGAFGQPGDTAGDYSQVMIYGGVRF